MKRFYSIAIAAAAALLVCTAASAQSFRSGYFLDNYVYGYRINPAQINKKSFLGLGTGNIDLQHSSTIGMASLLFPTENGVVTGLNSAVSAEEFLGRIPDGAAITFDENINILSLGVVSRSRKSMHTFEINTRVNGNVALPYDLFAFLKQGGDRQYDLSGINVGLAVTGDVSYGMARRISDKFAMGLRLHFLVAAADVKAYSDGSNITMKESATELNTKLHLQTSGILELKTDDKGNIDPNSAALTGPYVGGYGGGIDLGFEFTPTDWLSVMASVTGLGAISRNNTTNLIADSSISYSGIDVTYEDGNVEADYQQILDKLTEVIVFEQGDEPTRLDILPFDAYCGMRLKMPFFKALSVGALGTYHYDTVFPWYEVRGGVTLSTRYFLSLSANAGIGTRGPTVGGGLNIHLGPLNILAGADTFWGDLGMVNGIPVPLDGFILNAHLGVCLTL